jgi:cytochrome c-type biogenesis protein CcmE
MNAPGGANSCEKGLDLSSRGGNLEEAMSAETGKYVRFGAAISVIVLALCYLAYTGVQESKSYYVTIQELHGLGDSAYTKKLRVGGSVQPHSIHQNGTHADFVLTEKDPKSGVENSLPVKYRGTEPPPDTFKDDALALVVGEYRSDGFFYAKEIQAKCASKYAPQQQGTPAAAPSSKGY